MATTKLYQVTLDSSGNAVSAIALPDEPDKLRTIRIRESSEHRAKKTAEDLFSLAK